MKAIEPNLYTRNGYFYFRRTVPQRYWHITIRRELTIALATQNHAEARSIASQVNFRLGNLLTYINLSEANELDAYEKLKAKVQGELEEIQASVGYKHVTAKLFMGNGVKRREKQRTFREVWELYLEDCKYDGHKSRDHKKSTYLMFEELLNPKCFSEIAQAEALAFKQSILKIPPNAKKKFKGESYKAICAKNITTDLTSSSKTINNRLRALASLFNWAIKNDLYDKKNPFSVLKIREKASRLTTKTPFDKAEIETLFKGAIYTGCKGTAWSDRFLEGHCIIQDSLYWVPLIGLFSGLRMNEICQLHISDICIEGEIPYFNVNSDSEEKALKTASSKRRVPIHSYLLENDFLNFVNQKREAGSKRLFDDIPKASDGTYSSVFSKRFTRLLRALGIKRKGLCFHSLRHTFIDALRNAGVDKALAMALAGHSISGDIHSGYGLGYSMTTLLTAIEKLEFDL